MNSNILYYTHMHPADSRLSLLQAMEAQLAQGSEAM